MAGFFFFNKDTIGNSLKVMGTKVQGGDGLPSFINLGNLVGLRILLQGWLPCLNWILNSADLFCLSKQKTDFNVQLHQLKQLETSETLDYSR